MARRALLTGATGFIGRWVARALSRRGDLVFAIRRGADGGFDAPNLEWLEADLLDAGAVFRAVRTARPALILHLAAKKDGSLESLEAVNVGGTEKLMRAAARGTRGDAPMRIVISGSAAEYGAVPEASLPIDETTPGSPVGDYGLTKSEASSRAIELGETLGVDVTVARVFNVTGPGEPESLLFGRVAHGIAAAEHGNRAAEIPVGPLGATRDIIDVRDVAEALLAIADSDAPPPLVNIGRGLEESVRDHVGRLLALARVPVRAVEPADPALPPPRRHVADISRLTRLGFRARTSLSDSARDLVEDARARGS